MLENLGGAQAANLVPSTVSGVLGLVFSAISLWGVKILRTYVQATRGEKRALEIEKGIASIVELASGAIAFADDLDATDQLGLSEGSKKGLVKLDKATDWLQRELARNGIEMNRAEASSWVRAQFQKQIGDGRTVSILDKYAAEAVEKVLRLQQGGQFRPPAGTDPLAHWSKLAADYLVVQVAKQQGMVSRDEAETWVRSELLVRQLDAAPPPSMSKPTDDELRELAEDAVEFVRRLKSTGPLSLRASPEEQDAEATVVSSWLITEAAKRRLDVSTGDLARTLVAVLNG